MSTTATITTDDPTELRAFITLAGRLLAVVAEEAPSVEAALAALIHSFVAVVRVHGSTRTTTQPSAASWACAAAPRSRLGVPQLVVAAAAAGAHARAGGVVHNVEAGFRANVFDTEVAADLGHDILQTGRVSMTLTL